MIKKVRGGKVTTTVANQNIIDREDGLNRILKNVSVVNLGLNEIHVIVNGGDMLALDSNETLNLGDLEVDTLVIVEGDSTVKYIGVE